MYAPPGHIWVASVSMCSGNDGEASFTEIKATEGDIAMICLPESLKGIPSLIKKPVHIH